MFRVERCMFGVINGEDDEVRICTTGTTATFIVFGYIHICSLGLSPMLPDLDLLIRNLNSAIPKSSLCLSPYVTNAVALNRSPTIKATDHSAKSQISFKYASTVKTTQVVYCLRSALGIEVVVTLRWLNL